MEDGAEALVSLRPRGGIAKPTPELLMLCLARLIRCAIVASGTRNALAISAVVSPPTARNVSAMADGRVSAGWQHMKRRTSVSSSSDGCFVGRRDHVLLRRCLEDDASSRAGGAPTPTGPDR